MAQIQEDARSFWRRAALLVRQRPWIAVVTSLVAGLAICAIALGAWRADIAAQARLQALSKFETNRRDRTEDDDEAMQDGDQKPSSRERGSAKGDPSEEEAPVTLIIDVAGAVVTPGIVELEDGSRVDDAILAAGGLSDGADLSTINRAERLVDGQRVYIPQMGEQMPAGAGAPDGADAPASLGVASSGLVNINTAGIDELDALPGVGPSTARAIVEDREMNGPFASAEDLKRVSGIGEKKFEKLKSSICV